LHCIRACSALKALRNVPCQYNTIDHFEDKPFQATACTGNEVSELSPTMTK